MLRIWLGCAVVIVGLVAAAIAVPRLAHRYPCDSVVPNAADMGLRLSDTEQVVSCEHHASFPDSSARLVVRTASPQTRTALLQRSSVSEELERTMISENDGPFYEEVRRPNLERSKQVYLSTTGDYQLSISYDDGIESGLLLTVWAMEM
ncbi:hypothetical protein GIY30_02160 [Gordonia sp. HNM0687]|uniref:Uncharacterized protein n=1 Tax=Gordonia mangrovi TaxID=2665643 RepID=A0A6L7GN67_9ACTN|nr:hypothetical protein [Gordonia mangrovi]MXP20175.1 hypothetical protein [Gordonia mangrovi]UVF79218.1 hypothetical protein NWF22_05080 [Gordonia mangrovi]